MTLELSIQGARNLATGKHFVFLENLDRARVRLINPAGNTLDVPASLFSLPETFQSADYESIFTPEQLEAVEKVVRPRKRKTTKKKTTKKTKSKTGLGASWSCQNLTFFKHEIEPLDPKQHFEVSLVDGRKLRIVKEDFLNVFSDVTLSNEYSKEGSYIFREFPERAEKYIVSEEA